MATVIEEHSRLPERIKASAQRIEDIRQMLANEIELRNELIVRAIDQAGIPQRNVAEYAGVKQPHILRILAGASSE